MVVLALASISCAADATSAGDEPSGDVALIARGMPNGEVAVTSVELTVAERDFQQEVWTEAGEFLNAVQAGSAKLSEFRQWLKTQNRTDLLGPLETHERAVMATKGNVIEMARAGGVGKTSEALTFFTTNPNDCVILLLYGLLEMAAWTGYDYGGSVACFTATTNVHVDLRAIHNGLFYRNIRSVQTYTNGLQTMSSGLSHYAQLPNASANPVAPWDYRFDPYVHGQLP